ncbi:O-antigen ligase family protein [Argonema antarcticum]|uniref:O-antigen ligase family protein n=1 Tax=Argonema antarcticum TaxID=2942763 RepID=UPI002012889E|nr:O-antigen polymerase [Argonema antarcticum A004/B2]
MKHLYRFLFVLSIILINPWGSSRGEIWTQPKIFAVILITLLNLSILWTERFDITIPRNWKISKLLWEIFLGIGLISTIFSPFPLRSLFGQNEMGDGWLYWLLIAAFTLSNTLVLKYRPSIVHSQLNGLLIGGVILALSIFPQVLNWKIDYTVTTGQLLRDNILVSTIFQAQQPIGLYSHRGHAAFVLAAVAVLAVVSWQKGWINNGNFAISTISIIPALLFTQNRAGILALIIAVTYLLGQKYYQLLIPATLVCLLAIGINTTTRKIDNLPLIKQITSDRIYLWQLSASAIVQRPIFGWGMNGFGIAYPYIYTSSWTPRIVHLGDFSFDYVNKEGVIRTKPIISNKAHNLILDSSLSVGILGMVCYGVLLGFCLWCVVLSPNRGVEAVALAYLVFAFTWFECAQFTYLFWWVLSLSSEKDAKAK